MIKTKQVMFYQIDKYNCLVFFFRKNSHPNYDGCIYIRRARKSSR